ncbi:MAG: hypothetical protein AAFN07_10540 [Pseudomonadota bacterium]
MSKKLAVAALSLAMVVASHHSALAQDVDEFEPQVDTSADLDVDGIEPGVDTSAVDTTQATATVGERDSVPATGRPTNASTVDSIQLNASQITGNQELPQVLYIVPWKNSDLGDLVGRPVNTLLDEVLAPADREVLKRQIAYYEDLNPETDGD